MSNLKYFYLFFFKNIFLILLKEHFNLNSKKNFGVHITCPWYSFSPCYEGISRPCHDSPCFFFHFSLIFCFKKHFLEFFRLCTFWPKWFAGGLFGVVVLFYCICCVCFLCLGLGHNNSGLRLIFFVFCWLFAFFFRNCYC